MRWQQDEQDLDDLNHQAMEMASQLIRGVIIPNSSMSLALGNPRSGKSGGVEEVAVQIFDEVKPRLSGKFWEISRRSMSDRLQEF